MAGSVNRVILIGNVCADPEIRMTQAGKPIANLRLATNETWRDKATGERKEKAEFHTVVCFNENLSKVIEAYVKKGSKLYVSGSLQTRAWEDRDGAKRYSTELVLQAFNGELVLLDSKDDSDERTPVDLDAHAKSLREPGKATPIDLDDEVPF